MIDTGAEGGSESQGTLVADSWVIGPMIKAGVVIYMITSVLSVYFRRHGVRTLTGTSDSWDAVKVKPISHFQTILLSKERL